MWNEGQRSIPVEWLSCLYKALRNCGANSTHPSQPSDPQTGPKCDLNYSPLIDAAVLQSKGDKTWEQFLFLKIQLTLEYFPCCCPTLQRQEVFFALGTKTFPITSAALLCNLRGNRVWYRDNWGGGKADICLGTGRSVPELVSAVHQQHGKCGLHQKTTSLILMSNSVPGLVLHVGSSTLRLVNV